MPVGPANDSGRERREVPGAKQVSGRIANLGSRCQPRDMLTAPRACPFQPRCTYEVEQSRLEVPPLRELEPGHFVACFNPVPETAWTEQRTAVTAG